MIFAVDFDGTCVLDEYPKVGMEVPNCLNVLQKLVNKGHKILLHTSRYGDQLQDAVDWFEKNKIPLHGVNKNPDFDFDSKIFTDMFIDDRGLGCPLQFNIALSSKPYVDWKAVEDILINYNII